MARIIMPNLTVYCESSVQHKICIGWEVSDNSLQVQQSSNLLVSQIPDISSRGVE